MKLSIIIVSYNTAELTHQTIKSVIEDVRQTPTLKQQTEIIVVDNNSQDESVTAVHRLAQLSWLPIHVVSNKKNVGFARANNQGLTQAGGQYLLLLNSDTLVQPGALGKLVQAFEDHPLSETTAHLARSRKMDNLGLLAASLLNPDGTPQPQGGSFPTLLSLACHLFFLDDLPVIGRWLPSTQHTGRNARSYENETELIFQDWVGGTALMIRREVLADIGTLDEEIFMYGEDIEYCLRARNHHWDVALHPQALITHIGSASSSSENAIVGEFNGYLYIWSKHKPLWQLPLAKTILRIGAHLRWLLFAIILTNPTKAAVYRRLGSSL